MAIAQVKIHEYAIFIRTETCNSITKTAETAYKQYYLIDVRNNLIYSNKTIFTLIKRAETKIL